MKKCRVAAVCILLLAGCVTIHYSIQRTISVPVALHHAAPQRRELRDHPTTSPTNASLEQLLSSDMFNAQRDKLQWISDRIARMSHSWTKAYATVRPRDPALFTSPKKILLLPGLLTEYSSYNFAANAYKGGYLGELVQWSDLIAGLHMLHHKLTIITSMKRLTELVPLTKDLKFDLVLTDYIGLVGLKMSELFVPYKCRIRVLDSFGSEPFEVFRTLNFSKKDFHDSFNIWNFEHMSQFWSYFPHTPDNTFLGTVVEEREILHKARRSNKALIYGKEGYYISGRENYLNVIGEYMELHSTFKEPLQSMPKHIVNDGVMTQENVQKFLQSARLFIGLGFPYDGPGPLEALANGCPFIQPRFSPPHSAKNMAFFRGKPTSRSLSSQHPYLEQFVGEPYVYTVDATDPSSVRKAVTAVLRKGDLPPLIPYELTAEGFLERVGSLILHQDFCDGEDVALNKHATASSSLKGHSPQEAVDGLLDHTTCWWSQPSTSSWWSVDLGRDVPIRKIRVYFAPDVLRAKQWSSARLTPFQISLFNSNGKEVAKKTFHDARAVHVWDEVYVLAGSVRIESLQYPSLTYMVLCGVEVYRGVEELPVWPALYHLKTKVSEPGVSCKDTCARHTMICEPVYFKYLNTEKAIRASFKCKSVAMATKYNDHAPGVMSSGADDVGKCVLNSEPMLLSCAGSHDNFVRLCPCRRYAANQVALPPNT